MKKDELDRILSEEDEIVPSARFVSGVMQAVRTEAATPPPIPFPWMHASLGIAAWIVTIVWGVMDYALRPQEQGVPIPAIIASYLMPGFQAAQMLGVGWICLALFLTLGSTTLARYVVRRSI